MSGFDHNNGRQTERLAQSMAEDLDCNQNGRGVARYLQELYSRDRCGFSELVKDINRNERNGRGDDLTITNRGDVYVTDRNHQYHVGRIQEDNYGNGRNPAIDPRFNHGREPDCDPRFNNGRGNYDPRFNHGRSGVDIDINNGHRRGGINIDIDINTGRYPSGQIPIPDCYGGGRPRQPVMREPDCDPRYEPQPVYRGRDPRYDRQPVYREPDCDQRYERPPVVYQPPVIIDRPPVYVDRDCYPPQIRRRQPDYGYEQPRRGGYNQDGEVVGTIAGSIIGGVIGHNSGGRRDNTLFGVLAGGLIGNRIGNAVDNNNRSQYYSWR